MGLTLEDPQPRDRQTGAPRRDRILWWMLGGYWLLLLFGTHMPGHPMPAGLFSPDKVLHLTAYAVLSGFIAICVTPRGGVLSLKVAALIALGTLVYGAADELTQPFFGRSCDLHDWYADAVGVALGLGAYAIWSRFRLRLSSWASARGSRPG